MVINYIIKITLQDVPKVWTQEISLTINNYNFFYTYRLNKSIERGKN